MGQVSTKVIGNDFRSNPELKFTIVIGEDDVENIFLKGYAGNPGSQSMPAGVTLTSNIGNAAATLDYLAKVGMSVQSMKIQTDNTANFQESVTVGELVPPGISPDQRILDLSSYRQPTGNGYSDVLEIADYPFSLWAAAFIKFSKLKGGSTTNVYLRVPEIAKFQTVGAVEAN